MLTLAMRRAEEVPDEGGSNSHQPPPAVNPEEYVDILQVQQILLEGTNRRTRAPPAAGSFPPDQRGRMILEGYPHPHHPPPYYYSNYAQHQQAQAPSVEELFALWFGSTVPGSEDSLDVCPEDSLDVCPEDSLDVCPEDSLDVCPEGSLDVCPENSLDVCPECSLDVCPEDSLDVCPEGSLDVCPEDSLDVCPEGSLDVCPEDSLDVCPEDSLDVCPEDSLDVCSLDFVMSTSHQRSARPDVTDRLHPNKPVPPGRTRSYPFNCLHSSTPEPPFILSLSLRARTQEENVGKRLAPGTSDGYRPPVKALLSTTVRPWQPSQRFVPRTPDGQRPLSRAFLATTARP
uniref:Uncharacterized protein n=1 Tax=Timema genevievae TaxID=629358 RepID=A0A7R9JNT9_TIMGE|nr:unnamed protein product [Timema genevievae]